MILPVAATALSTKFCRTKSAISSTADALLGNGDGWSARKQRHRGWGAQFTCFYWLLLVQNQQKLTQELKLGRSVYLLYLLLRGGSVYSVYLLLLVQHNKN